jgi:hypothetical protein
VDGTATAGIADIEVDTPGDITGTGTTTPDITDGTAVGAGLLAGTIRGFCRFPYRFLTLTTADTDMGRDMDMARVTGTVTEPGAEGEQPPGGVVNLRHLGTPL